MLRASLRSSSRLREFSGLAILHELHACILRSADDIARHTVNAPRRIAHVGLHLGEAHATLIIQNRLIHARDHHAPHDPGAMPIALDVGDPALHGSGNSSIIGASKNSDFVKDMPLAAALSTL